MAIKVVKYPSPNYDTSNRPIEAVVLHGTAGSVGSALNWLCNPQPQNPKARVSANYVVSRAGVVYELVDWRNHRRAWANGIVENWDKSLDWLAWCIAAGVNPNDVTVSIEHEASELAMRGRAPMTDAQFNASIDLTADILRSAGRLATDKTVVGHYQISGGRKRDCPGVINPPAYTRVLWLRHKDLKPAIAGGSMFDQVRFTGNINLGNLINALIFLITSVGLYYRIKAEFTKRQNKTGPKMIDGIKSKILPDRRKKDPPDLDPPL